MLFNSTIPDMRFKQWLWRERENRLLLLLCMAAVVIQFAVFKVLYPYPNFMPPDSNSYMQAAQDNQFINLWAIGYSKFLRLFSGFTSSDFVLVLFQYLLLQGSVLYLLFTIRYLFSPGKRTFRLMTACIVLNPILLHIANFVSSDALFIALSLIWFTQLLWILYKPTRKLLIFHAVILLLAFMVRYNALFYPFISIIVILTSNINTRLKTVGIICIIVLLGAFTGRTMYQYYIETHTIQYSAFGGWIIGSNALYGYAYAIPEPVERVPARFRALHRIVNKHMDSIRYLTPRPDAEVAIYYFWDFKSPLRVYMDRKWQQDTITGLLQRWTSMAPLYADYGSYLIKKYPLLYIQYYVWPNFIKYYAPPAKFMAAYNLGSETVTPITVEWFGWKSNKVRTYFKNKVIRISDYFTPLTAFVNIFFILGFVGFAFLDGFSKCSNYARRGLWWMFVVWLGNMVFSVFSAPIELRYQLFPMIITLIFSMLLAAFMLREILTGSKESSITKLMPATVAETQTNSFS